MLSLLFFSVNSDECMMTRMQEMSLDYHFTVEQEVGSSTYAFFGFNGNLMCQNSAETWEFQSFSSFFYVCLIL